MPVFVYTNIDYCKYLLLPLLDYQASGQYPNKYAVHDLGEWASLEVRLRSLVGSLSGS